MVTSAAVGSQHLPRFYPRHRSTFQREQLTAQRVVATLDTSLLGFAELLCSSPRPLENAPWRPHQQQSNAEEKNFSSASFSKEVCVKSW